MMSDPIDCDEVEDTVEERPEPVKNGMSKRKAAKEFSRYNIERRPNLKSLEKENSKASVEIHSRPLHWGDGISDLGWPQEPLKQDYIACGSNRTHFTLLLDSSIKQFTKPQTLRNGFRVCRLYLCNPHAIDYSRCLGKRGVVDLQSEEHEQPEQNEPQIWIYSKNIQKATKFLNSFIPFFPGNDLQNAQAEDIIEIPFSDDNAGFPKNDFLSYLNNDHSVASSLFFNEQGNENLQQNDVQDVALAEENTEYNNDWPIGEKNINGEQNNMLRNPLFRNDEEPVSEMKVEESTEGKRQGKKQWMTQEILDLMEERPLVKHKDPENYSEIQLKIRKKIRQAKEQYNKEIEDLNSRHDTFNVHKKTKEAIGRYKKRKNSTCRKKYIEKVFTVTERPQTEGLEITQSEVEYAIKTAEGGKAFGADEIPIKLLKIPLINCQVITTPNRNSSDRRIDCSSARKKSTGSLALVKTWRLVENDGAPTGSSAPIICGESANKIKSAPMEEVAIVVCEEHPAETSDLRVAFNSLRLSATEPWQGMPRTNITCNTIRQQVTDRYPWSGKRQN
ncbi:hypothetical protein ILUMI_26086 [Ignelater luminosus]|uniref:Uncharacterized protein n=1 Tax=Ignelater luminosus TaxID=2038154 RepID=A0A8K0C4P3_IGNLU|nr:hypothetical protein ILUMI_26086 [Ignelater luminosus]